MIDLDKYEEPAWVERKRRLVRRYFLIAAIFWLAAFGTCLGIDIVAFPGKGWNWAGALGVLSMSLAMTCIVSISLLNLRWTMTDSAISTARIAAFEADLLVSKFQMKLARKRMKRALKAMGTPPK